MLEDGECVVTPVGETKQLDRKIVLTQEMGFQDIPEQDITNLAEENIKSCL